MVRFSESSTNIFSSADFSAVEVHKEDQLIRHINQAEGEPQLHQL